jgi:hypothetical protein
VGYNTRSSRRQPPERELERAGEVREAPSKVIGKRDLTKMSSDDGRTQGERVAMEAAGLAFTSEGREKLQKIIDSRQAEIQNSPRKSFEDITRKAYELDIDKYDGVGGLKYALYDLSTEDNQQPGFTNLTKASEHSSSLERIAPPSGVEKGVIEEFLHFLKNGDKEKYAMRMSINPHPDYTAGVMNTLVQKMPEFFFVSALKVGYKPYTAVARKDPILLYYDNPPGSGNRESLEESLRETFPEDMLREGYPGMMKRFGKGMASADGSKDESISFTKSRVLPIAEVRWEHRHEQISYEEFLREVEERYREHGIDPENPEWNLHRED